MAILHKKCKKWTFLEKFMFFCILEKCWRRTQIFMKTIILFFFHKNLCTSPTFFRKIKLLEAYTDFYENEYYIKITFLLSKITFLLSKITF
jgi:hypothetical protein